MLTLAELDTKPIENYLYAKSEKLLKFSVRFYWRFSARYFMLTCRRQKSNLFLMNLEADCDGDDIIEEEGDLSLRCGFNRNHNMFRAATPWGRKSHAELHDQEFSSESEYQSNSD